MNHDWQNVPMPPRVAARPRTKEGYPVPYVNFVDRVTGPDLRVLDQGRVAACVMRKVCAICGGPLERMKVFIGGDASVKSRMFADPPMHEECARYASKVCPYLATQNYRHASVASIIKKHAAETGVTIQANPLAPGDGSRRPEKMALYFCVGFRLITAIDRATRTQTQLIQAYPPRKLEWF